MASSSLDSEATAFEWAPFCESNKRSKSRHGDSLDVVFLDCDTCLRALALSVVIDGFALLVITLIFIRTDAAVFVNNVIVRVLASILTQLKILGQEFSAQVMLALIELDQLAENWLGINRKSQASSVKCEQSALVECFC